MAQNPQRNPAKKPERKKPGMKKIVIRPSMITMTTGEFNQKVLTDTEWAIKNGYASLNKSQRRFVILKETYTTLIHIEDLTNEEFDQVVRADPDTALTLQRVTDRLNDSQLNDLVMQRPLPLRREHMHRISNANIARMCEEQPSAILDNCPERLSDANIAILVKKNTGKNDQDMLPPPRSRAKKGMP